MAVLEFLGGALRRIVTGYVARNIIGVLCQVALCARGGWMTLGADVMAKPVLGLFT